jgi:hypothetical protein
MKEFQLKIGEQADLRKGILRASHAVVYAGMPSEQVYSLAFTYFFGNQALGVNLFVPKTQKEVTYKEWRIVVLEVRPDRIRLRIENPDERGFPG